MQGMTDGFAALINATRSSDGLQWETMDGMPVLNMATGGSERAPTLGRVHRKFLANSHKLSNQTDIDLARKLVKIGPHCPVIWVAHSGFGMSSGELAETSRDYGPSLHHSPKEPHFPKSSPEASSQFSRASHLNRYQFG